MAIQLWHLFFFLEKKTHASNTQRTNTFNAGIEWPSKLRYVAESTRTHTMWCP
jgi:hypothetical protein